MKKLLSLASLALIFGLASCDKDDGPARLNKEDAQQEIAQFNSTATQDLQDLAGSDGLAAIKDLSSLTDTDDPFGRVAQPDHSKVRHFLRQRGQQFRSIFASKKSSNGRTTAEEPFNYDGKKGVYTWNASLQQFERTGNSTIISILFPTEGSQTNNAELRITAFEETEVIDPDFGTTSYMPTLIQASIRVNGTEAVNLDLEVSWDEYAFPLTADVTLQVSPFTARLTFDVSGSRTNTLSTSISKGNEVIIGAAISVNYSNSSKSEESLKSITGYVQLKNMKLQGSINADAANAEEPDLNDIINVDLFASGKKVGDVIFVTEETEFGEEVVAYLKYSDGTQEKLEVVLQPVVDEIDEILN